MPGVGLWVDVGPEEAVAGESDGTGLLHGYLIWSRRANVCGTMGRNVRRREKTNL